ncbi:predicted protein [Plenodomus lingam JN3]|uniref:Uncharacterized protein n=1 Tax=Leptosphaeria maculans (strain JN3 / isolate v23.1.3 / race Av1-4-5-6-7-8) TaxID=985895 RepID=E4ZGP6_LEPMJ|nr:predicted protein [Plenodomus lingam JN3]CBX90466.1 predicted protein [Plenodomus lingam JN3]
MCFLLPQDASYTLYGYCIDKISVLVTCTYQSGGTFLII